MKVLTVSDRVDPALYDHFDRSHWRDIELLISCGDLPPEYLDFLCTELGCPVLYVRGNHDEDYPRDAYAGCFNLHGRLWKSEGLSVVGFEGCRRYNDRGVQYSEREMRWRIWKTMRRVRKVDVVVTHAPACGCNDLPDPCHSGFECYRDLVQRFRPKYLIHGHSHLYGGQKRIGHIEDTTAVNAFGHYVLDV
jgi:Icc-related predicted phosphoesterase